ncbi:putative GARP complex subunit Vps53 [Myxozyma melibiosi]|uniref:GARP complex subunit Vps53 n=1 Tax=Myxozyma melibiosi TaxID=54550 RepID=A0ABR1F7N4_9ASCO
MTEPPDSKHISNGSSNGSSGNGSNNNSNNSSSNNTNTNSKPVEPSLLDPLDQTDYDPVTHLSEIFAAPETFSAVPQVRKSLRSYSRGLDDKIEELLAAQTAAEPSVQRVAQAHTELSEIFEHIETVRKRAVVAEDVITEMTADIRKLDETKRNLTASMTMLKRLQMLTTAYEQLGLMVKNREYKDAAQLLEAVTELVGYFKSYRSITQIANLSKNVASLQYNIAEQVSADFEMAVDGRKPEFMGDRSTVLQEACALIDALGESYRQRQITWYCNVQLREYRNIFRGSEEAGSLDNISRRYSYLKRMLKSLEPQIHQIFPPHWLVAEALCRSFCEITREDYKVHLSQSGRSLNVDLLLQALEETMEFEQFLEKRFSQARSSIDSSEASTAAADKTSSVFGRSISEVFEPYLGLWVESQDRKLSALVSQYSNQMIVPPSADDDSPQQVLPSSVDLFLSYRKLLAQSAKISTGVQLLNLAKIFAKYLQQYADRALSAHVQERAATENDVQLACLIMSTANYCHTTADQLEQRIQDVIDEEYKSQVNFDREKDAFMTVTNNAVQSLVRKVEAESKNAWREMLNTNWGKLHSVGDQSAYVTELIKIIESNVRLVIKHSPKEMFVRSFCDRVLEMTVSTFLPNIARCKPLTELVSEQLLLDCYVLKKSFSRLPVIDAPPDVQASASYLNLVARVMSRLESVLKAVLTNESDDLPDNLKIYLPSTNIVKRAFNNEKFRWRTE